MRKLISEIFEEFEKAPTREDKMNVLKFNNSHEMAAVLRAAFDPRAEFIVEELPVYKPSLLPRGMNDKTIAGEYKKLYIWEKNNPKRPKNLTKLKSDNLLADLLEGLDKEEAKILGEILTKKFKLRGLTYKLVKDTFPNLLP